MGTICRVSFFRRETHPEPDPSHPNWPAERRALPLALRADAAAHPGGSVAEIDGNQVSDPEGYVPPEAIVGVFAVGTNGRPTGCFLRNPDYGPVQDDFAKLTSPHHWLGWLAAEPASAIRAELARALSEQVAGAVLEWVKVIEDPSFLTGGLRREDDAVIVVRAGLAVPFALSVVTPSERHILTGTLSWVATSLHRPGERRDRTWFDVGMSQSEAATELERRLYPDRI